MLTSVRRCVMLRFLVIHTIQVLCLLAVRPVTLIGVIKSFMKDEALLVAFKARLNRSMDTGTHTHTHTHTHTRTRACRYAIACVHTCMHACMHVYTIHTHAHTNVHTYMHTLTHTYIHAYTCICSNMQTYIWTCIQHLCRLYGHVPKLNRYFLQKKTPQDDSISQQPQRTATRSNTLQHTASHCNIHCRW